MGRAQQAPPPGRLTLWGWGGGGLPVSSPGPTGSRVCCKATSVCASKATGMHAHTCTHTAVHTHTSMSTHAQYICMHAGTHACKYTHMLALVYTCPHMCLHAHTHTHVHTHVCNHTRRMSLVMHTCLPTHVHTLAHVCTRTHAHTHAGTCPHTADTLSHLHMHGAHICTQAHSHEQHPPHVYTLPHMHPHVIHTRAHPCSLLPPRTPPPRRGLGCLGPQATIH